jgi:HK97 family phage major capsid protein
MSESFIKAQSEARAKAWEAAKALLDSAAAEKRDLSAEEQVQFDRINAELDERAQAIETVRKAEEREAKAAEAARGFEVRTDRRDESAILRAIATGESRGHEFESRTLIPTDNTVPKSFYAQVFDVARLVGPMLDVSEVIRTTTGESLTIPTLTAYSTATLATATAAINSSDPTYSSITLGAFKYGVIIPVSNELLVDAGFDLASHLAQQAGNSLGFAINAALTTGDGSDKPNGVVTAAGSGITGGTGVAGAFTADNLIDLQYSLDGAARRLPGVAYMANTSSLGKIRKLKDDQGQYLYTVNVGAPDNFAGFPIYENPGMVSTGTGAKSVLFGHFPSYKVRMAGGLQVAQSSDYAFANDVTNFRFLWRVDGDLTHASHIKYFAGAAS